jgi:hypothetical protein
MSKTIFSCVLLLCCGVNVLAQSAPRRDTVREGFAFYFQNFKLEHQGETHTLQITVRYDYVSGVAEKDYPDYVPMAQLVENFLTDYPNENTYWEIVNKQLTQRLLDEYATLAWVTCEMQVAPSRRFKLGRTSFVTRERQRQPSKAGPRAAPKTDKEKKQK